LIATVHLYSLCRGRSLLGQILRQQPVQKIEEAWLLQKGFRSG